MSKKTITNIKHPKKFRSEIFNDPRGFLISYSKKLREYSTNKLIHEIFTYTEKKKVFRGLHFQKPPSDQGKLLTLIKGSIIDYVVNINIKSNFGKVYKFKLNTGDVLWIPTGYCHGYKTLTSKVTINYKLTKNYSSINSSGMKPEIFNIKVRPCVRSKQDALWKTNIDDLKKIIWK